MRIISQRYVGLHDPNEALSVGTWPQGLQSQYLLQNMLIGGGHKENR